jgi:hypothetical protein
LELKISRFGREMTIIVSHKEGMDRPRIPRSGLGINFKEKGHIG